MVKIKVSDYIRFAFDSNDADILTTAIRSKLSNERSEFIQLDFDNVKYATTSFFSELISALITFKIEVVNLSEYAEKIYNLCYSNALAYYRTANVGGDFP